MPVAGMFIALSANLLAQGSQPASSIRGVITDAASGQALPYVTVVVLNNSAIGAVTDDKGMFRIGNLPVGRYDIQVSFVGYEPVTFRELLVSSAKEVFVEIRMQEQIQTLDEVIVRPKVNKEEALNTMALAGARMISVEEANRYAGGFDDPARLATSFAGVSGNVSNNGISIRGNSPQFVQWKLEGVEIPNPTHYPDITGVGGGIFTAFSSQVLGNSDFFTGAFPAEYNNALAGVFDIQLRNGNNLDYEHTAQIGTLGIEFASEGPFKKGGQSSYLFNYRYSTMGLVGKINPDLFGGMALSYQDLSFKLNFPTKRAGTFSVWGIGKIDEYVQHNTQSAEYVSSDNDSWTDEYMGAVGVENKVFVNKNAYLKTTLAGTFSNNHLWGQVRKDGSEIPLIDVTNNHADIIFNTFINTKFSARHINRTGLTVTELLYNLDYQISPDFPDYVGNPMSKIAGGKGSTTLLSAFSQSSFSINERLTLQAGVTAQYFLLNQHWAIEPRASMKWKATTNHSVALAYGMHSRHEKLDYYFITTPAAGDRLVNKDLNFARAQHLSAAYDWHISGNLHLKVEPYYQYLYNVPVEEDGSFSIINHNEWFLDKALVNKGKGTNYGIDFTLERYLADGYYYMATASLFESRYCGGDGIWRDTRNNRNYMLRALYGKEWMLGKNKQNVLGANIRLTYQGGDRYTPADVAASQAQQRPVLDPSRAMEAQMDAAFLADFTVSFKINKKNVAHEFAFKMVNVTGYKENMGFMYYYSGEVKMNRGAIIMPNLSYKVEF
ncbi:prevent-host-death protein [Bacteroidia bacterium]|nr:prevent-host-death protein [Bacteroidia bacterium]GHT80143.1 prevent-host-death protein [Bacteroidia bacterium]